MWIIPNAVFSGLKMQVCLLSQTSILQLMTATYWWLEHRDFPSMSMCMVLRSRWETWLSS